MVQCDMCFVAVLATTAMRHAESLECHVHVEDIHLRVLFFSGRIRSSLIGITVLETNHRIRNKLEVFGRQFRVKWQR